MGRARELVELQRQLLRGQGARWRVPTLWLPAAGPDQPGDGAARAGAELAVRLRELRRSDGSDWCNFRIADERYLRPVEPTVGMPWREAHSTKMWRRTYKGLKLAERQGMAMPLAIEVDGRFAGQLTLGNIQYGTISNCWIGYWVHSPLHGRGIATAAVALGTDLAMLGLGLHRVEATVMENNPASRRVLASTGYREEGRLERNLHIDGAWTDHLLVAQTVEEVGYGATRRLARQGRFRVD